MAQTTNSIWGGAAKVEISTDGTAWTDISGHAFRVTPSASSRNQGQAYTFDGENPIVKVGKKQPQTVRVDIIYTEQTADAYEVARAAYESAGGGTLYVRWSPAGGGSGDKQLSSGSGFVQEFGYAEIDAESNDPIRAYFIVQTGGVITSDVP